MKNVLLIILLTITTCLPNLTLGQDMTSAPEISMVGHLSNAKMTGLCGAFGQMVTFQETTKLSGGDQFIVRFLMAEAARLGLTSAQFMAQCTTSIKTYDTFIGLMAEVEGVDIK